MIRFRLANPAIREAAGRAANKRIREQCLWPKVAMDIAKFYFDLKGWEAIAGSTKKPNGRVMNTAVTKQRRTG
jgi:hypothetical protein